jgi:hypothetical protein
MCFLDKKTIMYYIIKEEEEEEESDVIILLSIREIFWLPIKIFIILLCSRVSL